LAQALKGDFVDVDALLEAQTGMSPRALYTQSPERFKEAEALALQSIFAPGARPASLLVIAAGGGLIDNTQALEVASRAAAVMIYLEVSVETAWQRISQGKDLPPFLKTDNPKATHHALHRRRADAYAQRAHIRVSGDGKSPQAVALEIIRALESYTPLNGLLRSRVD
jgi:shikimate kinase